jgi:hypothetical protein
MTFGAEIWGPPLIQAGASALGGALSGGGNKETKMQKTQRKLVDQLLASLGGDGPYSGLYSPDNDTFQKSFVEPAQAKFRNQIAPEIQQQYIASGQQRGTGLDDQLLRAGVELDSLLNSHLADFQQNAFNRQQNSIGSILGMGSGAPNQPSMGQNALSGLGGYFGSESFGKTASNLFKPAQTTASTLPTRKGFASDWSDYKLGDARWGQR